MPGVPGQVIKEIIESEFVYNECLQTLKIQFFDPILLLEEKNENIEIFSQFIASFEFIVRIHRDLSNMFRQAYYHPTTNRPLTIPEIFENRIQVIEALLNSNHDFYYYQPFLGSFSSFSYDFYQLEPKNPLRQMVHRIEQNPELKGQTLDSLLIIPVQRIPRYLLLVEALIRELPPEDSCSAMLHQLKSNLEKVADKCNVKIGEFEDTMSMIRIFERFNRDARIIADKRKVVLQSDMKKVNNRNLHPISKAVDTTFILFNDVFVYSHKNGDYLEISNIYELRNCAFIFDLPPPPVYPANSFMVFNPIKSFSILCSDEYEFKQWKEKVTQTMDAIRKTSSRRFAIVSDFAKNTAIKSCMSLVCLSDRTLPKNGFFQCTNCCRVVCKACFDSWKADDTCTLCTEEQELAVKIAHQKHQELQTAYDALLKEHGKSQQSLDAETAKSASYYFQWKAVEKQLKDQESQVLSLSGQYKTISERLLYQLSQQKKRKTEQLEYIRSLREDNFSKCYKIDRLTQEVNLQKHRYEGLLKQHSAVMKQEFLPTVLSEHIELFKIHGASYVHDITSPSAVGTCLILPPTTDSPDIKTLRSPAVSAPKALLPKEISAAAPYPDRSAAPSTALYEDLILLHNQCLQSQSLCTVNTPDHSVEYRAHRVPHMTFSASGSQLVSDEATAAASNARRITTPKSPSLAQIQIASASPQPVISEMEKQLLQSLERIHSLEKELQAIRRAPKEEERQVHSENDPSSSSLVSRLESRVAELQRERDEFEQKYLLAADESKQIQLDYLNTMKELDLQHEKDETISTLQESIAAETAIHDDLQRQVEELNEHLDQRGAALTAQLRDQQEEFEQEKVQISQSCQDEIDRLTAEFQALINDQLKELKALREKCDSEMALRRRYHNELIDLRGNIRVFCRVRPPQPFELAKGPCDIVPVFPNPYELHLEHDYKLHKYDFERTFTPESTQVDVFKEVEPFVTSVLDGYNVCIFAYGQTGSGKTFTMEGPEDNAGVNFRAMESLFSMAEERKLSIEYTFSVSIVEIYNDKIIDLLKSQPLKSGIKPPQRSTTPLGEKQQLQSPNSADKYLNLQEPLTTTPVRSYAEASQLIESTRGFRKTVAPCFFLFYRVTRIPGLAPDERSVISLASDRPPRCDS